MSNHVPGGFVTEDVTFKNARRQSDILKEVESEQIIDNEVEAPISLTPEQLIDYYLKCIQSTGDQSKRRIFAQTIKWIVELQETKKKLKQYKLKEMRESAGTELPEDL